MATGVNYGKDTFCTDALRPGRLVTGAVLVAQAAYRRLITPRGTLLPLIGDADDAEYGFDVSGYIGRDPKNAEAALPGLIRAELLKDERIEEVVATVTKTVVGPGTRFAISIAGTTSAGPTFTLVMSVTDARTELVGITGEAA